MGAILPVLRKYVRDNATTRDIFNEDNTGFIYKINPKKPLYDTELVFEFDNDEDCLETINIDSDDSWFVRAIWAGNYEFIDYHNAIDDFNYSGHIGYFSDENTKKLSQIHRYLMHSEVEFADDGKMSQFNQKLQNLYKREFDELINSYITMRNDSMQEKAEEVILNDINDYLDGFGFKMARKFDCISTTIANLISDIVKYGLINANIKEVVTKIFESSPDPRFRWYEDLYAFEDTSKLDLERFNTSVEWELDKILDKIKESSAEDSVSYEDYIRLYDEILEKFQFDRSYILPKSKKYSFIVKGVTPDLKINVRLMNGLKHRDLSLTKENFYHLLYQPELFNLDYL